MRHSMKKRGTMVAAVALVAAFVPAAGNATGCEDSPVVDSLQMTVVSKDLAASPGDTVRLLVTVTRGLEGEGSPQVPASGVDSIVVLNPTWPYMAGQATTKTDGTALVKITVPKDAPRGWLSGYGVAEAEHAPRICGETATERGDWAGKRIVRIHR
ncbi:MAG TPA: hypothetical protein VM784_05025 [Actinomycetota bacterium]|nr:hypothetical protein [Actinomycetota bacterium]